MHQPSKTKRRCGYVLLTVVVMIAVASLLLSRLANTSMRVASVAIEEEQEMRNRWAVTSLRRFSLDSAATLLRSNRPDRSDDVADSLLWKDVTLAGQIWRVIVADESAKLNLIHLSYDVSGDAMDKVTRPLITGRSNIQVAVDFDDDTPGNLRWEQWLEGGPQDPTESPRVIAAATQRLTLWGDGRLNVTQCDADTIDALWRQLFGRTAPPLLHELRRQVPPPTARQLIRSLGLRETQANRATQWLAADSTCHSVWIFCQSDRRVSPSLFVEWNTGGDSMEHRGYEY